MSLNSTTLPPLELHPTSPSPNPANNDDISNVDVDSPTRAGMSPMAPTYPIPTLSQYQKENPFGDASRFRMVAMQAVAGANVRNPGRN